jgi:hypothetical protein
MRRKDRLVADFVAGGKTRPNLPEELGDHLTITADGLWVVWAYKLARQSDDLFVPMMGGRGYPADASAECRASRRHSHRAPDPRCTCGFHAVSIRIERAHFDWWARPLVRGMTSLTVALSGRVLAFESGSRGVLQWRAQRQTVVSVNRPAAYGLGDDISV